MKEWSAAEQSWPFISSQSEDSDPSTSLVSCSDLVCDVRGHTVDLATMGLLNHQPSQAGRQTDRDSDLFNSTFILQYNTIPLITPTDSVWPYREAGNVPSSKTAMCFPSCQEDQYSSGPEAKGHHPCKEAIGRVRLPSDQPPPSLESPCNLPWSGSAIVWAEFAKCYFVQ